jgi:hypothetical protein
MVHGAADVPAGPASVDSVRVRFDEQRLVSDAGLLLTATLAERLGNSFPASSSPRWPLLTLLLRMLAGR